MTRTVCLGKPTTREREVYEAVLEAQEAGVAAVRVAGQLAPGPVTDAGIVPGAGRDEPDRLDQEAGRIGERGGEGIIHGATSGKSLRECDMAGSCSKTAAAPCC